MKSLKESFNNENLHNELLGKIKDVVNNMPEFNVSPPLICGYNNQKGFNVYSDNGHGSEMKRFTVTIEDHKVLREAIKSPACLNNWHTPYQLEVTNKSGEFKTFKMFEHSTDNDLEIMSCRHDKDLDEIIRRVEYQLPTSLIRVQKLKGDITAEDFLNSKIIMNNHSYRLENYISFFPQQFIVDVPISIILKDDDFSFSIPPKCTLIYTFFFEEKIH